MRSAVAINTIGLAVVFAYLLERCRSVSRRRSARRTVCNAVVLGYAVDDCAAEPVVVCEVDVAQGRVTVICRSPSPSELSAISDPLSREPLSWTYSSSAWMTFVLMYTAGDTAIQFRAEAVEFVARTMANTQSLPIP